MVSILDSMEEYAKINNVPIMEPDGINFLTNYIKENNIKSILEIGSAIGYSAIKMCLVKSDIKVTTIERDEVRYKEAVKNIKNANMQDRINIIFDDAFNVDIKGKFDLIFIDAAKAQYIKFFEKFKVNLNDSGTIITDNLKFHGLTNNIENIKSKNLKALVKKINNYVEFLKENKEFHTDFIDIGDGIGVSKRIIDVNKDI